MTSRNAVRLLDLFCYTQHIGRALAAHLSEAAA